jgi:hypothetical protein
VPPAQSVLDYAEFTIGPAEGRTRWLHPAYRRMRRNKSAVPSVIGSFGAPNVGA